MANMHTATVTVPIYIKSFLMSRLLKGHSTAVHTLLMGITGEKTLETSQ